MKLNFSNHERNLQYLVIVLLLVNFVLSIGAPTLSSQFMRNFSGETVTVYPNGTTELQRKPLPPIPIPMAFSSALDRFIFLLPLTFLGIFLIPRFLFLSMEAPIAFFLLDIFFWVLAVLSIPFTLKHSKGISVWRRIIYVYLIAALIAGVGTTFWSPLFTS